MNLTDTQLMMLSQASQRADHALVLPERLKGGAAQKVVKKLLDARLVRQVPAVDKLPVWRRDEVGGPRALLLTEAGLSTIGVEPDREDCQGAETAPAPTADRGDAEMPTEPPHRRRSPSSTAQAASPDAAASSETSKQAPELNIPRIPSKQETIIGMLRRSEGASVAEIMQTTGWQAHSVRGFLAGTVKKKLGLSLVAEKGSDGERRYHIAALAEAAA